MLGVFSFSFSGSLWGMKLNRRLMFFCVIGVDLYEQIINKEMV
jgi:hypothetical protein